MNIGILGSGGVGRTLAAGFLKYGHDVVIGTRTPENLADWQGLHAGVGVASPAEAAKFAELGVLAVKGTAAVAALQAAAAGRRAA